MHQRTRKRRKSGGETAAQPELEKLWASLCEQRVLVPVTLLGWGRPLKGSAGTYQIDSAQLTLHAHSGRYRCEKCRRTTIRQGPRRLSEAL